MRLITGVTILTVVASIGVVFYVISHQEQRYHECQAKGGTLLEGQCVKLETIPIKP